MKWNGSSISYHFTAEPDMDLSGPVPLRPVPTKGWRTKRRDPYDPPSD